MQLKRRFRVAVADISVPVRPPLCEVHPDRPRPSPERQGQVSIVTNHIDPISADLRAA